MDETTVALRFGAALGLGVLLGLERERSRDPEKSFAGVRTIGLIALMGALAAYLQQDLELPWLSLASFVAVAALVVVSYAVTASRGELGVTTEVSALIAFLLGWLCIRGEVPLAAGLAVATALVLALKQWLHGLAGRIESEDVNATLKFTIITLIILPLVPERNFGPPPLDVINLYQVWLMVVLISALNFASYILVKVVGPEHGIGVTGLLGGLISSTAATLGFAQRSRQDTKLSPALALGILLAWAVMFLRVIVMVAIINRPMFARIALVMGGLSLTCLGMAYLIWRKAKSPGKAKVASGENPFELGRAIQFGVLFGVVTFLAKAAEVYLGDRGLYLAGAIAGLTDVDAITLSMANLANSDPAILATATTAVVLATAANTLTKAGIAMVMGSRELRLKLMPAAAVLLGVGTVLQLLQF